MKRYINDWYWSITPLLAGALAVNVVVAYMLGPIGLTQAAIFGGFLLLRDRSKDRARC